MDNKNSNTTYAVVVGIIIIVLIVIGIYAFRGSNSSNTAAVINSNPNGATTSTSKLSVNSQYPGKVVYLTTVTFDQPGWVVIHKSLNGAPGAVIGAAYFEKGTWPGTINLTEATVEGGTYIAMLHGDDGDKMFDEGKDQTLFDATENPIQVMFTVTKAIVNVKA